MGEILMLIAMHCSKVSPGIQARCEVVINRCVQDNILPPEKAYVRCIECIENPGSRKGRSLAVCVNSKE